MDGIFITQKADSKWQPEKKDRKNRVDFIQFQQLKVLNYVKL